MKELSISIHTGCAFLSAFTLGKFIDTNPVGLFILGIMVFTFNIVSIVRLSGKK